MARIRSVKPELRTSIIVASWSFDMRYFFVLLWGYLDDSGRGLDIPKQIAGDCFPHDEKITASKVDKWLTHMTVGLNGGEGPVCRYEVDGRRYLHTVNAAEHQRPNRPTPSRLPPCPLHEGLTESLPDPDGEPPPEDHRESLNGSSTGPHCPELVDVDGAEELDNHPPSGGGARASARRAHTRGTRIPDDFAVTPAMVTWAQAECPDVDGRRATASFVDYWHAKPGKDATKLDWVATWRNWLRKDQAAADRTQPRATSGYHSQTDANIANFLGVNNPPTLRALPGGAS